MLDSRIGNWSEDRMLGVDKGKWSEGSIESWPVIKMLRSYSIDGCYRFIQSGGGRTRRVPHFHGSLRM